jgi:hypothetical protein
MISAHHRALGAADLVDHVLQAPADHVEHLAVEPWATPMIWSPPWIWPDWRAGPPGMVRWMTVYSLSALSTAPMPSSFRRMLMSKFSEVLGDM